jgi:hypothetical protein
MRTASDFFVDTRQHTQEGFKKGKSMTGLITYRKYCDA